MSTMEQLDNNGLVIVSMVQTKYSRFSGFVSLPAIFVFTIQYIFNRAVCFPH